MQFKKASLLWKFGFAIALVALQAGCERMGSPTPVSKGPAPSTAPSVQNPPAEAAAPTPTKAPAEAPVPATRKPAAKPAKKPAPAVARATPPAPGTAQPAPAPVPAPQLKSVTFEAGTPLKVRTTTTISTASHKAGDTFVASLEEPLSRAGWVVAPKGATVEGRIIAADQGGRVKGTAHLDIALDRLQIAAGNSVQLSTNTVTVQAKSTEGKDVAKIGIGAGLGAIVGAIAGGKKGAAIGAASGAGAGTAVVLSTRGDAAEIGSETLLSFELSSPLTISEKQ